MIILTKTRPKTNVTVELCGTAINVVVHKYPKKITIEDIVDSMGLHFLIVNIMNVGLRQMIFINKMNSKIPPRKETWFTIKDYHLPEVLFKSICDNPNLLQYLRSGLIYILKDEKIINICEDSS